MSRPLLQNMNQAHFQSLSAFNFALVASPSTGSTNDNVLLWAAGNQAVTGPTSWANIVNDAALGTSITINKAGTYIVELGVGLLAAAALLVLGISQDVAGAGLTDNLTIGTTGALDCTTPITIVDADLGFQKLTTKVYVSQQQEIAGSVIRFHAGAAAGAAPATMLDVARSYYRIRLDTENQI